MLGLGAAGAWATDAETLHQNRNRTLRALLTGYDNSNLKITRPPSSDDGVCVLTSSQVEGPFYLTAPVRSDISEGKPGVPFELTIQVVEADGCTPLSGVAVEIWHTDAEGNYSAHPPSSRDLWDTMEYLEWDLAREKRPPINDEVWLRGAQQTDETGIVRFQTIFPGWYDMRTPHIHFKIGGPRRELFTSQFYFDDATANGVYRNHEAYKPYGESPYNPNNDFVIKLGRGAEGLLLGVQSEASGKMHASAKVGVALPA